MLRNGSARAFSEASVRVRRQDRATAESMPTLPVTLVLDNLRSAFNVGNIIRLAEATQARQIATCGYTASPPHAKLVKTARGCEKRVACRHFGDVSTAIRELRNDGHRVYGVETIEGARHVWDVAFAFPAAFVLGNEALGISDPALALCDEFVTLPCFGLKNSLNVGNCAAVVLYAAVKQWLVRHQQATEE